MEREVIEAALDSSVNRDCVQTCGLGVVESAVHAASWIERQRPTRVVLAGIAGRFTEDPNDPALGTAEFFQRVKLDGVGLGQGTSFQDPAQLGWTFGETSVTPFVRELCDPSNSGRELLTVCAATSNAEEAVWRRARFSDVIAEDMEGFAVANACDRASVPLTILRGYSNQVGNRDKSTWKIGEALQSVARYLGEFLGSQSE